MRPLRLTMQAFGPYAEREVVDLREALEAGLFGIYGPTGSGKSSIFSAMSFALFGESAKGGQDPATFRSDYAHPDLMTEVELVFEIGTKRYLVRRRPEQMRKALKGDGETKERHSAWLFDVTGIAVDDISPKNTGKVLAERKTKDVQEEVSQRLGYGAEQFRQIVLLPQGKFETFLTAKTNERLAILRELFDVSLYKRLAQKMKEDAKTVEDKILADRRACQSSLEHHGFETTDALTEGITTARSEQEASEKAAKQATSKALFTEKQLARALNTEKAFLEHGAAGKALRELEDKTTEMQEVNIKHDSAKLAQTIVDVDNAIEIAREVVKSSEHEEQEAITAHGIAKSAANAAVQSLSQELGKAHELETLRERRGALKRHQATLEQSKKLNATVVAAADDANTAEDVYASAVREHEDAALNLASKQDALKTSEEKKIQHDYLSKQLRDVQETLNKARQHEATSNNVATGMNAVHEAESYREITVESVEVTKIEYELAEVALANIQALHLAEKLLSGDPCPVCGSSEHPAPAKGNAQSAGLNQAFEDARDNFEEAQQNESEANCDLSAAQATLTERQAALELLVKPEDSVEDLESKMASVHGQLIALGAIVDAKKLAEAIDALERGIADSSINLETTRTNRDELKINAAVAKQAYESHLTSVPEALRSHMALEKALKAVDDDIEKRETAHKEAVEAEQKTREAVISANKDEESSKNNHRKAQEALVSAETVLAQRLKDNGLTLEQYKVHKVYIPDIQSLEQAIRSYNDDVAAAKDRIKRAESAIKDTTRPNIEGLKVSNEQANETKEQASKDVAQKMASTDHLVSVEESIADTLEKIQEAETAFAPLGAVASSFNGHNDEKVELETFAIASMFDRVLDAANLRLRPMTSGQYTLERAQDDTKGSGRRGLGIAVHDIHTGRSRDTSSLSGGETFLAALALALGLSDVVESLNGGIHLDTIFIDEGFGTLDSETLDQALQTLQDLVGQSRAVGLISHVELVQQVIPNGFQIEKSVNGSHVAAR